MKELLAALAFINLELALRKFSIGIAVDGNWDESKHPRGQPGNAGQFASSCGPLASAVTAKRKVTALTGAHQQDMANEAARRGFKYTPNAPAPFLWDHITEVKGPECFANVSAQRGQRMGLYAMPMKCLEKTAAMRMFAKRQMEYADRFYRIGSNTGIATVPEIRKLRESGRDGDSISAWRSDDHNVLFTLQDGKWHMDDGYYGKHNVQVSDSQVADAIKDTTDNAYLDVRQRMQMGDPNAKLEILSARHNAKERLMSAGYENPSQDAVEAEAARVWKQGQGSYYIPSGTPLLPSEWSIITPFNGAQGNDV